MSIQTCYDELGGNYAEILSRLGREDMIRRFGLMFLKDSTFADLRSALQNGDTDQAFRSAHTLKGVCKNLSFTALDKEVDSLVEILRNGHLEEGRKQFQHADCVYEKTISALRRLQDEEE
ncbi:MAG: Hpt domain-containing protein [Desulfovibrionaceae bacterium]|nr:Hpt domain-containing protein [Desulfovibrionaceae bacterium]